MAFVNLKDLKANIGGQLRLTLNSSGVYQEKQWTGGKFNVFQYEVIQDGKPMTLDATDAIKRKLDENLISTGDDFLLSCEQYTNKEGQLLPYWKVEKISKESANPQFENIKKSVNEFDQKLKADKAVKEAVKTTNATYTNGARFGMIFNNVVKLYIANGMMWTKEQFVSEFNRVEGWVESCENKPNTPVHNNLARLQEQRIDASSPSNPVVEDEDDLPF